LRDEWKERRENDEAEDGEEKDEDGMVVVDDEEETVSGEVMDAVAVAKEPTNVRRCVIIRMPAHALALHAILDMCLRAACIEFAAESGAVDVIVLAAAADAQPELTAAERHTNMMMIYQG